MSNYDNTGKYVDERSEDLFFRVFGGDYTLELASTIEGCSVSSVAHPGLTPKMIYEALEKTYEDEDLDLEISKKEARDLLDDFLLVLRQADAIPDYNDTQPENDWFIQPFLDFLDIAEEAPEGANYLFWLLGKVFYIVCGINVPVTDDVIKSSQVYDYFTSLGNEKQDYKNLVNEYRQTREQPTDDIMKTVEPLDVSYLPEYIIDSLYKWQGKYYSLVDIEKAMTAAGGVATALQRQDLEDDLTNDAEDLMTGEEIGLNYIKKLKLKREKKWQQIQG